MKFVELKFIVILSYLYTWCVQNFVRISHLQHRLHAGELWLETLNQVFSIAQKMGLT